MLSLRRRVLLRLYKLSDAGILLAALLTASWFTTSPDDLITFTELLSVRIRIINFIGLLFMIIVWHMLFSGFQLYRSRRLDQEKREIISIIKATTLGSLIFMLAGFIFRIEIFNPTGVVVLWLSSTVFAVMFRIFLRYSLKRVRFYGRNLRFLLIVGTNKKAHDFARLIKEKKESGYRLIGYIDKHIYIPKEGMTFLGTLKDFPAIMKDHIIDEVVITLPVKSCYEDINEIVQKAEEQGISIRYLSQLFNTRVAHSRHETFEDFQTLTIDSGYKDSWQYVAKRVIDIILAAMLLVFTFPLFIIAAVAIKLTSPGPVLFIQDRVGYNKRIFRLYKFRTMVSGAEKLQAEIELQNEFKGPAFKIINDPRITTPFSRWLRKLSIDELPQLFNVIKGDMSMVGPRPLPVRDYSGFDKDWQRRRFSVMPGITCTWQVNGRNKIPFDEWMKMDMEYIDNWRFSDDIKILCKTIPAVLKGKGAA